MMTSSGEQQAWGFFFSQDTAHSIVLCNTGSVRVSKGVFKLTSAHLFVGVLYRNPADECFGFRLD